MFFSLLFLTTVKTGIFSQSDLFDPKLTSHFLQYGHRHARELCQALLPELALLTAAPDIRANISIRKFDSPRLPYVRFWV